MGNRDIYISTSNTHNGRFAAHGETNYLRAENDLLIVHATGPFNVEFIEDLIAVERPIFEEMNKRYRDWYALLIFRENAMAGPDVLARYAEFRKTMTLSGYDPRAVAFVMAHDVEGREFMGPLLEKLYLDAGLVHQGFTNESDARRWIERIRLP